MKDFRYDREIGFERRCPECLDWWPITLEFWDKRWLTKCRACVKTWRRNYQNEKYRTNPEFREVRKEAARLSAWMMRVNEPERLRERRRRNAIATAERRRERQRINYWANRDAILARRRARKDAA